MQQSDSHPVKRVLVNGKHSNFTITGDAITWWPHKSQQTSKNVKRVDLLQLIGFKRKIPRDTSRSTFRLNLNNCKKHYDKIKIFYAKENYDQSSNQLMKLASLTVQDRVRTGSKVAHSNIEVNPSLCPNTTDSENLGNKLCNNSGTNSSPPSCYASEGSSGHLSSLSSSSSSNACSPSPSPVQALDYEPNLPVTLQNKHVSSGNEIDRICSILNTALAKLRLSRPKRLLVFVNPFGGKGNALYLYNSQVKALLDIAQVESTLVVTKHANHARDTIEDPLFNVEYFDGVVCVGGDGMFSELMNGLLFRYNRDKILASKLKCQLSNNDAVLDAHQNSQAGDAAIDGGRNNKKITVSDSNQDLIVSEEHSDKNQDQVNGACDLSQNWPVQRQTYTGTLGGIGEQFISPPVPIGVIGAGSTDANSYGLIGTNDVVTATLNIILGNRIKIDTCSIHSIERDDLMKFVSTFVAYGYFGDVIRESEKLRWLGPSRYDITGANNLIKNRTYEGMIRILVSEDDGSPSDSDRCHRDCKVCSSRQKTIEETYANSNKTHNQTESEKFYTVERDGFFMGVNAAVTACRCPQTKKGFSPNNHLGNGCVDLILVRPCTRFQYIQYLLRTGWTSKSAFDLGYVEAFRCRQFEFLAANPKNYDKDADNFRNSTTTLHPSSPGQRSYDEMLVSSDNNSTNNGLKGSTGMNNNTNTDAPLFSSWNVDGEILNEHSIRVKVNNQLLTVFGTGEPTPL